MESTISRLYRGKLHPGLNFKPVLTQYGRRNEEASKRYDALCNRLPEELKEDFARLVEGEMDLILDEMEQNFIEGFRVGVRLMIDVFMDASAARRAEEYSEAT